MGIRIFPDELTVYPQAESIVTIHAEVSHSRRKSKNIARESYREVIGTPLERRREPLFVDGEYSTTAGVPEVDPFMNRMDGIANAAGRIIQQQCRRVNSIKSLIALNIESVEAYLFRSKSQRHGGHRTRLKAVSIYRELYRSIIIHLIRCYRGNHTR